MTSVQVSADELAGLPALLFFAQARSGASRRMASLVAWVKVTQKRRLNVIDVDVDSNPDLVSALGLIELPALVLIKDSRVVARLEGRTTGRQIDEFIQAHLAA